MQEMENDSDGTRLRPSNDNTSHTQGIMLTVPLRMEISIEYQGLARHRKQ